MFIVSNFLEYITALYDSSRLTQVDTELETVGGHIVRAHPWGMSMYYGVKPLDFADISVCGLNYLHNDHPKHNSLHLYKHELELPHTHLITTEFDMLTLADVDCIQDMLSKTLPDKATKQISHMLRNLLTAITKADQASEFLIEQGTEILEPVSFSALEMLTLCIALYISAPMMLGLFQSDKTSKMASLTLLTALSFLIVPEASLGLMLACGLLMLLEGLEATEEVKLILPSLLLARINGPNLDAVQTLAVSEGAWLASIAAKKTIDLGTTIVAETMSRSACCFCRQALPTEVDPGLHND